MKRCAETRFLGAEVPLEPADRASLLILMSAGLSLLFACASSPPVFPRVVKMDASSAEPPPRSADVQRSPTAQPAGDQAASGSGRTSDSAPVGLSLEEAVFLAIGANRDLGIQRLAPVLAGTFEQIEHGVFDPEFFASFQYQAERSLRLGDQTQNRFEIETNSQSGEIGARQRLSSGTNVEVSGRIDRSDITSSDVDPLAQTRLGLSVTQSLLRGFGPAVNLARVHQARLETQASFHQLEGFTASIVADVERAYWNHVLARREIEIFERSLSFAEQQETDIKGRIEVGLLGPPDAALAEAEVARRNQDLIDARSRLAAARLQLARLIDVHFDQPLTPASPADIAPIDVGDIAERIALGRMKRPELNEARARLEQRRLEVVATRNGVLPQLDLFVNLGRTGFATEVSSSISNLDQNTFDIVGGVSLSQVLGARATGAQRTAAYAQEEQAKRAIDNLAQLVELDVRLALNELERAQEQIEASQRTRKLQAMFVDAEQQEFEVGTSTALAVAQAQRDLVAAEISEAGAVVAYRLALVQLYAAEGSLLSRRGVRVSTPES